MINVIQTPFAPEAIGPYSQAILAGDTLYISGQIPYNPETMTLVSDDIQEQTQRCLENLKAIVEAAGLTLNQVVKVGIFITNTVSYTHLRAHET